MKKIGLLAMIEASFFAAFALILDLLPSIKISPSISISFAMVPIFIVAFRWGTKVALASGFLWGLLQVAVGDIWFLTPVQFAIEYFIAFAFVGFAGLFYQTIQTHLKSGNKKSLLLWIVIATFVGSIARYFWHFVAGFIFWGEYAPEGMSPVLFSLVANGSTMLGAAVLCSIVLALLILNAPRLLERKGTNVSIDKKAS